jgi:hypothetical protein
MDVVGHGSIWEEMWRNNKKRVRGIRNWLGPGDVLERRVDLVVRWGLAMQ